MSIYGQRIRAIREAAGLTQEQLGNKIQSTGVTIMRYEKGIREPRLQQIEKIADALNISVNFFQASAPFEDLTFLNNFKAVILKSLENHNCFSWNHRALVEIGNYEYWQCISQNIASIVRSGPSSLSVQYKTTKDSTPEVIKFASAQISFDFNEPLQTLIEKGYTVQAYQVLMLLNKLNKNGIAKAVERIIELSEIQRYADSE